MDMRRQVGQVDEYGNPIQQTDAYGNPLSTHEVGYGTTGAGYGTTTGAVGGQPQMTRPETEHRGGGILRRSGSSSSSSSEDDGMGGRRKKGLKEKIKEKLPGGHKTDEHGQQGYGQGQAMGTGYGGTTTTTTGATGYHDPEKKGFMEKIKEKLPGGDKTDEHRQQGYGGHGPATTGTGYGGTTTTTGATGHHDPENKGFMEKIKEKLPGHN